MFQEPIVNSIGTYIDSPVVPLCNVASCPILHTIMVSVERLSIVDSP
eukprot:SAG31_NODE_20812_length_565_cov_0.534335_1_plen_46_part_10